MESSKKISSYLLQSKSIKLQTTTPFTWASGWKSPIYCDNRRTLSFPAIRDYIRDAFVEAVQQHFPNPDYIAGVATGAIAQGVLVAQALNIPFVYVRSSAKKHGMENLVEGVIDPGKKVVVIEDLVSTGGSSLKAVEALKTAGFEVMGLLAIFTYGFDVAVKAFEDAGCPMHTLSSYNDFLELALEENYIKQDELEVLQSWRQGPSTWMQ